MYARMITFTGARNIDDGVTYVQEKVLPTLQQLNGYRWLSLSADRASGVFGIFTLWETDADREASFAALANARQEGGAIIGGEMTVENFEEVLVDMAQPPGPGARLMITRTSVDPAKIDENAEFFRTVVLPQIKAGRGYCAVRNMINRETGEGAVGSVWTDEGAAQTAAEDAESRREQAASRGVTLGDRSLREVLFADMR